MKTSKKQTLHLNNGETLQEIHLTNGALKLVALDYGARLHQLFVPDRHGVCENILLTKENIEDLKTDTGFYGATCGPVAGRIKDSRFHQMHLPANEGKNLLHSGESGWSHQQWQHSTFETADSVGVTFTLTDTKSGFKGAIQAETTYELFSDRLVLKMNATANEATLFNPANHAYFNLSGKYSTIREHFLQVDADKLVAIDQEAIPTGTLLEVEKTPYDFREGKELDTSLKQLPNGIDHCFVLNKTGKQKYPLTFSDKGSGRTLQCTTSRQAVVLYTATTPETDSIINSKAMSSERGIAIEFQEIPDIVHYPKWGSIDLYPGKKMETTSTYFFSAQ